MDAEYFRKDFIRSAEILADRPTRHVADLAKISDGNHFSISDQFVEIGVPYYRGQDVTGRFFVDTAAPIHITPEAYAQRHMKRSYLQQGDVLLSIVGTIGELSLVASDQPATCSCKLAILRPKDVRPEFLAAFLRSEHGQNQIERLTRGALQKGLILEDMDQLWVPSVSAEFEERISRTVQCARQQHELVAEVQTKASFELTAALGLADWTPPEPLAYSAKASAALAAGRMDARFFAPRIQALLNILSADGRTISDVAKPRREKFRPEQHVMFDYIEISDMDGAGATDSTRLIATEAPSRATWHVRPGDIITSSVRPIRRLSAEIMPEQAGFVCSSGFVVVDPEDIAPEVLLTYLRLPVICELLDLYASASMYPAITDADIFNLPMPELPDAVAAQIVAHVQNARAAKARAAALLDAAKRAVEIAIEDSEAAALAYLATVEGAN